MEEFTKINIAASCHTPFTRSSAYNEHLQCTKNEVSQYGWRILLLMKKEAGGLVSVVPASLMRGCAVDQRPLVGPV